ncbi:MAG: GNAT family N-acetyltransferase [Nanoarchaeota archaeon]|nr:GNAT family N-acetyltransferase [Nanoarchaeota archaeon]
MKNKSKHGFLIGKRLYLRTLKKEDLTYIQKWSNDPEIRKLIGEVAPMSQADADKFLERVHNDDTREWFVIVIKENEQVIGEGGLLRMFPVWRTTDISLIIGEKDAWGKGYGTEAILLLLDYAFRYLKFHRVAIGVVGFNEKAIRFWGKVGFKKEGIQRDGYYYNHKYYGFVMMSILEDEFRELHGGNNR